MTDMIALAVPIREANGRLMATLSFHAPTLRFDAGSALRYPETLGKASAELATLVAEQRLSSPPVQARSTCRARAGDPGSHTGDLRLRAFFLRSGYGGNVLCG